MLHPNNRSFASARHWSVTLFVMIVTALVLPVLARSLLHHSPEYDELLHVLAARGIQATGQPGIDAGFYLRAEWYSRIVAFFTSRGSDELLMGRLPALAAGMALIALVAGWVTRKAGWLAGLAAGLVLALAPITIHLSVMVRFYTLHALVVTVMFILLYEASTSKHSLWFRVVALLVAVAMVPIGFELQDLTELSAGAGVAALLSVLVYDQRRHYWPWVRRHWVISAVLIIILLAAGVYALNALGIIERLRGVTPAWSVDRANYYGFYLGAFGFHMPFIWPLFPIMAIAALAAYPRPALYCLVIVLAIMVASSIATQKAMRYVYHVYPALVALWGMGFAKIIDIFVRHIHRRNNMNPVLALLLVLLVFGLAFAETHEFKRGLKLVAQKGELDEALPVMMEPDWRKARDALADYLDAGDTVVANSGVKSIHAFGRYDYELNRNVVDETDTKADFGMDERTGHQVIGSAEAVEQIIQSEGNELFVAENRMINQANSVNREVVTLLEERCQLIELPAASRLTAWRCTAAAER